MTCGISNALDGSEDHFICKEILKDIDNDEDSTCAHPDKDIDELHVH